MKLSEVLLSGSQAEIRKLYYSIHKYRHDCLFFTVEEHAVTHAYCKFDYQAFFCYAIKIGGKFFISLAQDPESVEVDTISTDEMERMKEKFAGRSMRILTPRDLIAMGIDPK